MLIAETASRQLNPTSTLPRNLKLGILANGKRERTPFNQPTTIPRIFGPDHGHCAAIAAES